MSDQTITCNECSFENAAGSKFCNNCGARLPETTKIMCPRCQTPNSRDRMYCDNCGSRLVKDTNIVVPEAEEPEEPVSAKPFSLPTRKPGDTGELDADKVPDWLKTGEREKGEDGPPDQADEAEKTGLPRLEDLTPRGQHTDDLPDWLVDEENEDPIVHAPTIITTEHFQDLLDEEEEKPTKKETADILGDDAEDDAALPDWLAASEDNDEAETAVPEADYESNDNLDWLEALSRPTGAAETEDEPAAPPPAGVTELIWPTSLLSPSDEGDEAEDEPATGEQPVAEADDWLDELGPPQTSALEYATPGPDEIEETPLNTNELVFPDEQLPDWMAELGPPQTNVFARDETPPASEPDSTAAEEPPDMPEEIEPAVTMSHLPPVEEADLPDWLASLEPDGDAGPDAAAEEEWLPPGDTPANTSSLSWLRHSDDQPGTEDADSEESDAIEFDQLDDSFMDTEPPVITNTTNWLDELADLDLTAVDDDLFGDEPAAPEAEQPAAQDEPAADLSLAPEPEILPAASASEPEESETTASPAEEEPQVSTGAFLRGSLDSDLPDWLSELDTTGMTDSETEDLVASEDLPEWVAQMRPSGDQESPGLSASLSSLDLDVDELEDLPVDVDAAELPDWLQDVPELKVDEGRSDSRAVEAEQLPAWLQADSQSDALDMALTTSSDAATTEEWDAILNNLPPGKELARADIPEWVQALKPRELSEEEEEEAEIEIGVEGTGPLAGISGVIDIEPVISMPRESTALLKFTSTKEQQQQAELLAQLAQKATPAAARPTAHALDTSTTWLRLTLALLLLATILLGLVGPNVLRTEIPTPSTQLTAVHETIMGQSGQPTLVAFEYTPAMAGELSPTASLLLAEIAAGGAPVLTMSQFAAGTAVADSITAASSAESAIDARAIGFIPGEAIGLRQVGHCIASDIDCSNVLGHQLDADTEAALANVGLIVVVTAERESLVNWIEQVGTPHDIPVIAAVTQSLAPVAEPYYASQQLAGVVQGVGGAAAYESAFGQNDASLLQNRYQAQMLAQMLAAVMLILGLLIYGAASIAGRGRGR